MAEKRMAGHPHHKGAGMGGFEKDHWQKDLKELPVADGKYCSEMNSAEDYHKQVEGLADYAKKHKMKY